MILQRIKPILKIAIAALTAANAIGAAEAGAKYSVPGVVISLNADGSGYAEGTLGGTRNSANSVERIYCSVRRTEILDAAGAVSNTVTSVTCLARNAGNQSVICRSPSDAIGSQLNGISSDSLITFYFDNRGNCTAINNYSSSSLERKKP